MLIACMVMTHMVITESIFTYGPEACTGYGTILVSFNSLIRPDQDNSSWAWKAAMTSTRTINRTFVWR